MKVVILCGGKGTRMSELTNELPKPLAKVGDKPLLWHIMKRYNQYGFDDFILLLGYKGEMIKEYFMNYNWKNHSFTLDTSTGNIQLLQQPEKWKITFLDTGLETMTGGRIKLAEQYVGRETFMLTYADGLADIDLLDLLKFHKNTGAIATVTGVNKISQFGTLTVSNGIADSFHEKSRSEGIINGGFFVVEPQVFDYVTDNPMCIFEEESLKKLALDRELAVYLHEGFWMAADTYKNVLDLNDMWKQGKNLWAK